METRLRRLLTIFGVLLALAVSADASTTVTISPTPIQHFVDNNGNACVGCKLFTYGAGTTTKQATYTDSTGNTQGTNPIILNSRGEAQVWLSGLGYKYVLAPATDTDPPTNPFWTVDGLTAAQSNGTPYVATNTVLKALTGGAYTRVYRDGFAAAGDGGAETYTWSASNCSISAGAGDNGYQVAPNSGGGCWVGDQPAGGLDARVWGLFTANAAGANNTAMQAAVTWACTNKQILRVFGSASPYLISSQISIGNGTSSAQSTLNNCRIDGVSGGADIIEMNPEVLPVQFKWVGAGGIAPIKVAGPIAGVILHGISVDCNSICGTGFDLEFPISSRFTDLMVSRFTGSTGAYILSAYPSGVSGVLTGAQHNYFENIRSDSPVSGGSGVGLVIGPATYVAGVYDVAQDTFVNCEFGYDDVGASGNGIVIRYADNLTFSQVVTLPLNGGSNGKGLFISPPTGASGSLFPGTINFFGSNLVGGANNPGAGWAPTTGVGFWPWGSEGGAAPVADTYTSYYGITDQAVPFGQNTREVIGGNSGTTAVSLTGSNLFVGGGGCTDGASGFSCAVITTHAGHIPNLTCSLNATGASSSVVCTLYVNNSATNLTCTITDPATTCNDNTPGHVATVANGAFVSAKFTGNGSASGSVKLVWNSGLSY